MDLPNLWLCRDCALGRNWWTVSALDLVHPEGKGKGKGRMCRRKALYAVSTGLKEHRRHQLVYSNDRPWNNYRHSTSFGPRVACWPVSCAYRSDTTGHRLLGPFRCKGRSVIVGRGNHGVHAYCNVMTVWWEKPTRLKIMRVLVYMYYTHSVYRTSIFGKNCAYYIQIFTVSTHIKKNVTTTPYYWYFSH